MSFSPTRSRRPKPDAPPRDMEASSFQRILSELVDRVPGAYGACMVDAEGESVDYAGHVTPFDVRLAAAHWRIVLDDVNRSSLGSARSLLVRGTTKSFLVRALPDGYALVVLLRRRAGFGSATRALGACIHELSVEAQWPAERGPASTSWFPVRVSCEGKHRPVRVSGVAGEPHALEVLGSVVGLAKRDRGYRVRLDSGKEVTLVREPRGHWYADESVDS